MERGGETRPLLARRPTRAAVVTVLVIGAVASGLAAVPGARRSDATQIVTGAPVSASAEEEAAPAAVVGDFDADRRGDLLWYGAGASQDHAWFGAAGRRFAGEAITVGGDYLPLTGDFDGDGHDDVFWYGSGPPRDYVWFGGAGHGFLGREVTVDGVYQPFVADFDGDRRDDIFWYHPGPDGDVLWYGTRTGTFVGRSVAVGGSPAPVVGDFDGSGTTDIVWYGHGAAADALWRGVAGGGFTGRPLSIGLDYTPRGGDFNGDRRSDILWFGPGPASDVVWYGGGNGGFFGATVRADAGSPPLVGDFDGNGASDLFWYQSGAAGDAVWFAGRTGFTGRPVTVDGDYTPVVADFDGDRRTDVAWYAPGARPDPVWYGGQGGVFASKSSIIDIHPALAPPVDLARVRADYDHYGVLAHALGATRHGDGYTNSREAFTYSYGRGFRVFEMDFVRLADGSAFASHDGMEPRFGLDRPFSQVTRGDLASRRFHSNGHLYTPLFSDDVVRLMRQHPDMYLVLDTKESDVAIFRRFLADAGGDPAVMERVIPHVFDLFQLAAIQDLYPVHSYLVALYRSQRYNRFDDDEVVSFVRRNRAPAVMMWWGRRDPTLSLADNMAQRRRYTDTFARRLWAVGAAVYVHSIRPVELAISFRSKGVAIYSDAPFPPYDAPQPEVVTPESDEDELRP